jgi:hypothetical protein
MCTYTCRHDYADFYCTYLQKDAGIWAHSCVHTQLGHDRAHSYIHHAGSGGHAEVCMVKLIFTVHTCTYRHDFVLLCTHTYEHDRDHVYIHEFAYQRGKPERWENVMPLKKSFSRQFAAFTGTRKWRAWHVGRQADWQPYSMQGGKQTKNRAKSLYTILACENKFRPSRRVHC